MAVELEEATHDVDISRVLDQMERRIAMSDPYLSRRMTFKTGANERRCIFRVPRRLEDINRKSLEPQVVSLGPYHHGSPHLQDMEELKLRCLACFMESTVGKLGECLTELGPLEKKVSECYSEFETINLSRDKFLEMMLVDGFFILTLFFSVRVNQAVLLDQRAIYYNPLEELDMVKLAKIYGDLLLLENQIPSSVLKKLYEICFSSLNYPLFGIATNFFGSISVIPDFRNLHDPPEWLHLLDLVRSILFSRCHNKEMGSIYYDRPFNPFSCVKRKTFNKSFSPIPCVSRLCSAGVKVNRHMADTFLDVKFKNGVIQMPDIILDDSLCSLLVNCVAFELLCNSSSKHFSIYVTLLDCLVNTNKDIDYLCHRGVIVNFLESDIEAAQFINNLGKDLTIYKDGDSSLLDIFENINKHYRKGLNWGKWTSFKSEYFGKPWLLISAFAGFVLLVLSFLQTIYTIYAYVHPKN